MGAVQAQSDDHGSSNAVPAELFDLLLLAGERPSLNPQGLVFGNRIIPVTNSIPRFTPEVSYSRGNFEMLREKHSSLQLDSVNGTTDRRETLLSRTGWPASFFQNKLILEAGCGAGPDTEVLTSLGARVVAVDIAGVDIAQKNLENSSGAMFLQASIDALPLRPHSFDIVFCHRVLQHTPKPMETLRHLLKMVKPGGSVFFHSYARNIKQMLRWKYVLLPITRRMNPERLYGIISYCAPYLFSLTNLLNSHRFTRALTYALIPFVNHSYKQKFRNADKQFLIESAIHDTFDALSPPYDSPLSETEFRRALDEAGFVDVEIVSLSAVTVARSPIKIDC